MWRSKSLSPPITAYDSTWASFSPHMLPQPPSQHKELSLVLYVNPLQLLVSRENLFLFFYIVYWLNVFSSGKVVFSFRKSQYVETNTIYTLERDAKSYTDPSHMALITL